MALINKLELESGLIIEQSYIRVQGVNGFKGILAVNLEVFLTKEACEVGNEPIHFIKHTFVPDEAEDSLRWDKQAYEYLKTLPDFYGAIDA